MNTMNFVQEQANLLVGITVFVVPDGFGRYVLGMFQKFAGALGHTTFAVVSLVEAITILDKWKLSQKAI